jgi:hypothetical protein
MEMTPYQWHMCQDETWVRGLLRPTARVQYKDRHEAIQFIEEYKQKHPMGNERAAIQSETAEPVQASRGLHLGSRYYCSNCNKLAYMENYCSSCGAKIIKED